MNKSKKVQVDVDCEQMGLKNYPIAGYPFTCYKEDYREPIYHPYGEPKTRRTSMPIHVEAYATPVRVPSIPRYRLSHVNKFMEVPVVQKVAKVVEIPEVREITKYVDVVKVVDVPVEQVRMVPKLKVREVEKIRHIPGPIEYIDVPREFIVPKVKKEIVEKIHEIPVVEDIEVEVPYYVPTPVGPPEEIRIEVPLPYDVPQFAYRPERSLPAHFPVGVRHVTHPNINLFDVNDSDEEKDEANVSNEATPKKIPTFANSSPPLGNFSAHRNIPHAKKMTFKTKEDDEQLDDVLYSYNIQYPQRTLSIKNVPNNSSSTRKYSTNGVSCCKPCTDSPHKTNQAYKVFRHNEYTNSNEAVGGMAHMYTNNQYRTPTKKYVKLPAHKGMYYYSYSAQNQQNQDWINHYMNKKNDSARNQQTENEANYNTREINLEDTYSESNAQNCTTPINVYAAQDIINENFNVAYGNENNYVSGNETYYYGDESNYVYGKQYIESSKKNKNKNSMAELIVKKANRRYR